MSQKKPLNESQENPGDKTQEETCKETHKEKHKESPWQVYIIECDDGTLYTGISNHVERRFKQHASGNGAKFFRGRQPKKLRYTETLADRSAASKREFEIKKLSRQEKLLLINQSTHCPD